MAGPYKIKLYSITNENARPELISPLVCQVNDTYEDLRQRLELRGCVDWPFEFWEFDDQCRIRKKFESMNTIGERVYVIPIEDNGCSSMSKQRRIEDLGASGSNNIMSNPIIEFLDLPDMDA